MKDTLKAMFLSGSQARRRQGFHVDPFSNALS
jgi:hypothetical protein